MARPLILLSNDDGYQALGIRGMAAALAGFADVVVCAPESEQSASSHAISLNRPLRLVERESNIFSVDGTPADCVYVALHAADRVLPRRPDVVVAGMNHGLNLGNDVFYSGTVAAAREGALRGVPAVALSAADRADRASACALGARLVQALLLDNVPPRGLLLNVNFPPGREWTVRATRLGNRTYQDGVLFRQDPRGGEYLWVGTGAVQHDGDEASDTSAYDDGAVGVTPLSLQLFKADDQPLVTDLIQRLART